MFKLTLLSVAALAASIVSAETAYFAFQTQERSNEFIFQLTDDAQIAHARRILSGEETDSVHVMGRIRKRPADYNPSWSFQLDPATINFFSHAIEVCDASVAYTEDHLDEACGAFLPGCFFCPWTSKLTREVKSE
ncbi:calmodulin [Mucor ambiguus]|uniref:Calmodulin n=1 Tax=Mucor ambiguus TaxID=91626 RepID=A0A0C9MQ86_9FUNG|nr:calmodulin [Mucor ambiguus]